MSELDTPTPTSTSAIVVMPRVEGRTNNAAAAPLKLHSPSHATKEIELKEVRLKPTYSSSHLIDSSSSIVPTTLSDALELLRLSRAEVAMLQSRLNETEENFKHFDSRGMDHSNGNGNGSRFDQHQHQQHQKYELSTSSTRDRLEDAYAHAHASDDPESGESRPVGITTYCGCIEIKPAGSVGGNSTLTLEQYFVTPFWRLLLKRMPWLVGLLLLQSFSASILASYDSYLEAHIIFTYFVPMVVGTGGNAGNQCSVMVTRALALGMGDAEVVRVIKKEGPIAILTAILLGIFAFIRVAIEYPDDKSSAAAIAVTLGVSIIISIALGIFFSYGIERVNRCDPADGATPLLSTISDIIGIALLCGISYSMVP